MPHHQQPPARGYNTRGDTPHTPSYYANFKGMNVMYEKYENNTNYSGVNVGYRPTHGGVGYLNNQRFPNAYK
jgi:hypothetical protein